MRLYEREKVKVLGPGSVILEDSQLSLRILGYVNHYSEGVPADDERKLGFPVYRTTRCFLVEEGVTLRERWPRVEADWESSFTHVAAVAARGGERRPGRPPSWAR